MTAEKVREKTKSKAKWGYEQLTYLLRIAEREKIDLPALEGSWAGAFGMSQFIPSSYWGYAVDGSGDGRADLYTTADAVFSVGNYLKSFGWKDGLSEEKQRAVVRRYNNSELYAATVLGAAAKLARGSGADTVSPERKNKRREERKFKRIFVRYGHKQPEHKAVAQQISASGLFLCDERDRLRQRQPDRGRDQGPRGNLARRGDRAPRHQGAPEPGPLHQARDGRAS